MDMNLKLGNALARVQRVHEPADLWDIIFAPTDFEASSTMCTRWFWDPELSRMHLHPQVQIPNAFPENQLLNYSGLKPVTTFHNQ